MWDGLGDGGGIGQIPFTIGKQRAVAALMNRIRRAFPNPHRFELPGFNHDG